MSIDKQRKELFGLLEKSNKKIIFIDLTNANIPPTPVRRRISQIFKEVDFDKVAALKASRFVRVMAGFIMKTAGMKNVQFFDDKAKALKWLKQK